MKRIRIASPILVIGLMVSAPIGLMPKTALAQEQSQMKDDIEQFAMDMHVGMQRANLTEQQREQIRKDMENLRNARKNHDRIEAFRSIRNFRQILDSGAFQPQDQQRINALIHPVADRAAHEDGRDRSQLQQVEASRFAAVVAGRDMGNLMRHDARHLSFFVRRQDQPRVDVEEGDRRWPSPCSRFCPSSSA